jgi:hypothetical protein
VTRTTIALVVPALAGVLALWLADDHPRASGQGHAGHGAAAPAPPSAAPAAPTSAPPGAVRITMDALHAAGGVPPGWRFSLPPGNPAAGRQVFVDMKCHACHAIKGETFPLKPGESPTAGPELSGMARHHPTEYLVESIIDPSAVLVDGPGYIGGDGRSIMPPSPGMTRAQLIDLVAYLESTGAPAAGAHDRAEERTAGGYRVRLVVKSAAAGGHDHHAHHHHGGASTKAAPARQSARLLAFVTDGVSGSVVPYAPVTARIEAPGKPAQTVRLAPAFGPEGFHYGAAVSLPAGARKIVVSVGPPALRMDDGAPAGLAKPGRAVFEWK